MLTYWTPEELSDFAYKLEDYHRVFGIFWSLASIAFTDSDRCPTACVYLKPGTRPSIEINKAWWKTLNPVDHVFVIVHECLHVLLNHGLRKGQEAVPNASFANINRAQDITINEMAESLFKLDRNKITDWQKYCWIATCFPGDATVLENETFVYYLAKLAKDNKELAAITLDIHGDAEEGESIDDELLDEMLDSLAPEELDEIERVMRAGQGGLLAGYLERKAITHKLKIRNLIRGMRTAAASRMKPRDTFVTTARRFSSLDTNLLLPNEHDSKRSPDKFQIALALDVSGSVVHLRPQFYELRELFLREKDLLDVTSYVFADNIKKITEVNQSYNVGGGNAPFQLIENELMKPMGKSKKPAKYPDCVIVITDGVAGRVSPLHPKRWLWLLTNENDQSSIPAKSRRYKISDVIFN
jgi:predicted metal-dependent peptidase